MFDIDSIDFSAIAASLEPTKEELAEREKARSSDPTRFENWFSAVRRKGVPHPETLMINVNDDLGRFFVGEPDPDATFSQEELMSMANDVLADIRMFGEVYGYPLFIRNSYTSHKHDWENTCFVAETSTDEDILKKISNIFHFNACMMPFLARYMIVRSFIETTPAFTAFTGNMPITEEYRLFYRDGEPVFWQPYWPEDAIEDAVCEGDWKSRLHAISTPEPELMEKMKFYAKTVVGELGGFWSVDFLIEADTRKPYLIDMAEGDKSFQSPEKRDF